MSSNIYCCLSLRERTEEPYFRGAKGDTRGFTLVEMLVAMAVTLLMMVALARGFGFIGDTVRESRVRVELSNSLRDITSRLRDELGRCTVSLLPAVYDDQQGGYFMYYEGPLTDATSSLFRATTSAEPGSGARPGSRPSSPGSMRARDMWP